MPRTRVSALLMAVALSALASGCGGGDPPARLPEPVQLDPGRLSAPAVDRLVATVRADPTTAAAIRQGRVDRVLVRAGSTSDPAATVAFLFAEPVVPRENPYDVLCDIAGQTPEWRGVAARVDPQGGEVESSPIWLTGANCVGVRVPRSR